MRAVAGDPEDIQIMYGLGGERRLDEYELPHLAGYEGRRRCASATRPRASSSSTCTASSSTRSTGRGSSGCAGPARRDIGRQILGWLEEHWREPDDGVWEVRGGRKQFVHSKVMVWVAVDRWRRWRRKRGRTRILGCALRDEIHEEICREGYDAERNTFTQYYGSKQLDASLLLIPQVGFLPPETPE